MNVQELPFPLFIVATGDDDRGVYTLHDEETNVPTLWAFAKRGPCEKFAREQIENEGIVKELRSLNELRNIITSAAAVVQAIRFVEDENYDGKPQSEIFTRAGILGS